MKFYFTFLLSFITVNFFAQTVLTIPQIQGSGSSSAYSSQLIKTTGIVTARFIGVGNIGGFFMQDATGDGNVLTSDGIFVSTSTDNVNVGDKVEITATVSEYSGRTQLGSVTNTSVISSNNPLPVIKVIYNADGWNWEQYEGMLIEFDQTLYVTSNYNLQRYGQLSLNPIRKYSPTNQFLPGSAEYSSMLALNAKAQITLDDGITTSNYTPIQFADANGTRRTGERTSNLQAVVDNVSSAYVIYPANTAVFYGNPRPTAPTDLGNYNLKVCAFNLEIYLADSYGQGYGPNNSTEAARQHTKILAALLAIDADIYGLIEIQEGQNALIKLVTALNTATVAGRYAYINDGSTTTGTTYTKVAYIYRTDKVSPYLSLKNNNNPSPLNRKKVQAFTLKSNNERFIFSINHLKAKSGCSSASGADADQGDGQSCYNATRVQEATSTLNFLNTNKTYYDDNDMLVMGDLNAYGKEDPIQTFILGGLTDMHRAFHADTAYSYMYNGEAGYLDHALASTSMRAQITGVSVFHINSDEPSMFEYSGSAYQPNMYRSSDHDPVVVGISLGNPNNVDFLSFDEKVMIKPTLVSDNHFTIYNAFKAGINNKSFYQLYSVSGILLQQGEILSNEFLVDVSNLHLSSGVYLVRALGEGTVKRLMVIKK